MSTRGLIAIRKDNNDKGMYNHWDSYPSYLGENIIEFIKNYTDYYISQLYDKLIEPNGEKMNKKISDLTTEESSMFTRYLNCDDRKTDNITLQSVLSCFEGNLEYYIKYPEVAYYIDDMNFIKDSLFCEWAYVINLDNKKLEIYTGYQKEPQENNRYGTKENDGYYPCKLIKEISLSSIRKDNFNLKKKLGKFYY